MRTADVDILIVPGWGRNSDDHWQARWARNLRTACIVEQDDRDRPDREAWVSRIVAAVGRASRPAVLVGHSCGVIAIVHAAPRLDLSKVAGALLVAVPDLECRGPIDQFMREAGPGLAFPETFLPLPMAPLPFPALLIASTSDPYCSIERARGFAAAWNAELSEAGAIGHINTASGHGPWPEGLLRFGSFLKRLG
jgi:hypothetical protein